MTRNSPVHIDIVAAETDSHVAISAFTHNPHFEVIKATGGWNWMGYSYTTGVLNHFIVFDLMLALIQLKLLIQKPILRGSISRHFKDVEGPSVPKYSLPRFQIHSPLMLCRY